MAFAEVSGMKAKLLLRTETGLRLVAIFVVLWCGASRAFADLEVSANVQIHATAEFEAPLAAHGTWVEVGSYGRCWHPAGVALGWRPYCTGEWVWTAYKRLREEKERAGNN